MTGSVIFHYIFQVFVLSIMLLVSWTSADPHHEPRHDGEEDETAGMHSDYGRHFFAFCFFAKNQKKLCFLRKKINFSTFIPTNNDTNSIF